MTDQPDISEQGVLRQEHPVHEVVRFDARNRQRHRILVEVRDQLGIGKQGRTRALVAAPPMRRRHVHCRIRIGQTPVIGGKQVVTLPLGDESGKQSPCIGEETAHLMEKPAYLERAAKEDAAQHQPQDLIRMGFGVGERQRRTP